MEVSDRYELGGFEDWFLPSHAELEAIFGRLGVSIASQDGVYWSSPQISALATVTVHDGDVFGNWECRNVKLFVLPIRQF